MNIGPIHSMGVIVNYKCSAKCRHCCYSSSPGWPGDYMQPDTAEKVFSWMGKRRVRSCHIGGGEPFLQPERLLEVCRLAKSHGIGIEYIETNGSWHVGEEETLSLLKKLLQAGVDCLLISVDPFHNEFIPYGKQKDLIRLCRRAGMGTFIWPGNFGGDLELLDTSVPHKIREYDALFGGDYQSDAARSYGLNCNGRAISLCRGAYEQKRLADIAGDRGPCACLVSTGHCHMDLYENYIPPVCTGFTIALSDVDGKLSREKYPALHAAYEQGPGGLLDYAKGFGFTPSRERYVNRCDLCFDIKRFLKQAHPTADIGYPSFFSQSDYDEG